MSTPFEKVKSILDQGQLAVVVGNGINRHDSPNQAKYAWDALIESLWRKLSSNKIPAEAYDIISLSSEGDSELEKRVQKFVHDIEPTVYQGELCQRMKDRDIPVLTTNFDHLLESSLSLKKHFLSFPGKKSGFTSYYPWNVYYSEQPLTNPLDGFAIWHINGMADYPRSMRLGLTHYVNQASRVKEFIHASNPGYINGSTADKNTNLWKGYNTWLHIIFNCPLLVFGLSLDVNETFLRWLLIEREKYSFCSMLASISSCLIREMRCIRVYFNNELSRFHLSSAELSPHHQPGWPDN